MKKKIISLPVSLALLLFVTSVFSACAEAGRGKIVTKTFPLSGFSGVSLSSSADVEISKGTDFSVVLSDYENLIELHELKVENGKLVVGTKRNTSINNSKALVKITVPAAFYDISLSGSGDITLKGVNTISKMSISGSGSVRSSISENYNELKVSISGSGEVTLVGTAQSAKVSIAGSGDVDFSKLTTQSAECSIAGSGDVSVSAVKQLKVSIAGSGDVIYWGNPEVQKSILGSGSVTQRK